MAIGNERYLRPMLDSGSSRVFNCNDKARKLVAAQAANPYFFKLPQMHSLVVLKDTHLDRGAVVLASGPVVKTKLYLPYNEADVYEGGRSIFYEDQRLVDVLTEKFGLRSARSRAVELEYDLKTLGLLDTLPSLDGFLMGDTLEREGIAVNESYLEVTGAEKAAISAFIRGKFEPLVRAAFGEGAKVAGRVEQLVDKVWEAKDEKALAPLSRALRFPKTEELAIYAAWKGVLYYTFEHERTRKQRESFSDWLEKQATPRGLVAKSERDQINQLRQDTIRRLRTHWLAVENNVDKYETLYTSFVADPTAEGDERQKAVTAFLSFLRRSRELYWKMGDALSKISHAVRCWDVTSAAFENRKMPADSLAYLLGVLNTVLASPERATSEVAW